MTRVVFVALGGVATLCAGIGLGFSLCLGDRPGAIVFGLAAVACIGSAAWVAK